MVLSSKLGKSKDFGKHVRPLRVQSFNCDQLPYDSDRIKTKMQKILSSSLKSIKENRQASPARKEAEDTVAAIETPKTLQVFSFSAPGVPATAFESGAHSVKDSERSRVRLDPKHTRVVDQVMQTSPSNSPPGVLEADQIQNMKGYSNLPR